MDRDPNFFDESINPGGDPGQHFGHKGNGDGQKTNGSADPGARRRFNPVRFKDIKLSSDRPYLVKGLLPREGIAVIWGTPKCGKSFWAYDLLLHVALGWEYRGRRVQQGVVVYVACEGERGLGARSEAFRHVKLDQGADPPFYLLTTRLDLVHDVEELIVDIRAAIGADTKCAAICIDTLNRSIAGSESKDEDMSAYIKSADRLQEAFGGLVPVIHHCGINGERPRGHTSLTGACDAQIAVARDAADRIICTVEHMKDGAEGDVVSSRLAVMDIGTDEDDELITSCIVNEAEAPDPTKASKGRLSPAQGRALQMLGEAINTAGEIPTASAHIPANILCVTEGLWRDYCYQGAISAGEQDAKRMAFKRAAEGLVAAGRVGKWEPWVWLT